MFRRRQQNSNNSSNCFSKQKRNMLVIKEEIIGEVHQTIAVIEQERDALQQDSEGQQIELSDLRQASSKLLQQLGTVGRIGFDWYDGRRIGQQRKNMDHLRRKEKISSNSTHSSWKRKRMRQR